MTDTSFARPDVALEPFATKVEPAIAVAQRLVDVLLIELERQRRRAREDLELIDLDLDLARRQLRVHGLGGARDHFTRGAEDELVANVVCGGGCVGGALGVDHELDDAGLVAEVDEDQAAVVAPACDPAGDGDLVPDPLGAKLARSCVPPTHRSSSVTSASTSGVCPGSTTSTLRAPRRLAWVRWPFTDRPA